MCGFLLHIPAKRGDQIGGRSDQAGLVLPDQGITSFGVNIVYPSRKSIYIPSVRERYISCDQRTAFLGRLDYKRSISQSGNDPVALDEVRFIRFRAAGEVGQQSALLQHFYGSGAMSRGINPVETMRQYADSRQSGFECATVGTDIDAVSQSAYNQQIREGSRQRLYQFLCHRPTIFRCVACTYNTDDAGRIQVCRPFIIEENRSIRTFPEAFGIGFLCQVITGDMVLFNEG